MGSVQNQTARQSLSGAQAALRPALWPWAPEWLGRLVGANRRTMPRHMDFSGKVQIGSALLTIADLSRGGMQIQGFRGVLCAQDRFAFMLDLQHDYGLAPATLTLSGEAIVAWRTGDRLGAAFYGLAADDRERLEAFLASLPIKT